MGIRFIGEFLPGLDFAFAAHPYLRLLGSRPPPLESKTWCMIKIFRGEGLVDGEGVAVTGV